VSLDAGERLAHIEAEAGVEGQRTIVKGGLHQPDIGSIALHDGSHQAATDARVLHAGIDSDGTDAGDDGALIEHIAADAATIDFADELANVRGLLAHFLQQIRRRNAR
jgi:hypothetical protein